MHRFVLSLVLVACGGSQLEPSVQQERERAELFSEPVEYRAHAPSAEDGRRYFSEVGVGDPYGAGIPYPIMRGMMARWPGALGADMDELADRFGFIRREGELPVGFHLTRDENTGVDFLVMTCEVCHAARVGDRVVSGLGSRTVRIHAYAAAFAELADDPSVTPSEVARAAAIEAERLHLRWPGQNRMVLARATVDGLHRRFADRPELARLAEGLPGRVATIEGFMVALNTFADADLRLPDVIGWAQIPDVRPWQYRETNSFDGASFGDPVALVAEADFAFGVRPRWFEEHRHIATSMFLYLRRFDRDLRFPGPIDTALATRGYDAFEESCAQCHGHYARPGESFRVSYRERVIPLDYIGTDRARHDALTDEMIEVSNAIDETRGLVWTRRSGGYVPRPLVDVWARGHYGHVGQWPDLMTVATAPSERPRRFIVHADELDLDRVGQRWREADGDLQRGEYLYDGTRPGYGVEGHPFWSDLAPDARRAVLEYLKTL